MLAFLLFLVIMAARVADADIIFFALWFLLSFFFFFLSFFLA